MSWCVGDVKGVWGAGRDSRHSGTRRGIEHQGLVIGVGCREFVWGVRAVSGCVGVYWILAVILGT